MTGSEPQDFALSAQDAPAADGVTHFQLQFTRAAPPAFAQVAMLCHWRDRLRAFGLVGQTPARYGGVGFGNLSARHPHRHGAFIITGTQTGARTRLGPHDFGIVTHVDVAANAVRAHGGTAPSSEAMTHAQCYAADPRITFVFHGHSPRLWQAAEQLGIAATPGNVAYGTPEMAKEVANLLARGLAVGAGDQPHAAADSSISAVETGQPTSALPLADSPTLSLLLKMGGHEDGIIAVGSTADAAGNALLQALSRLGEQFD